MTDKVNLKLLPSIKAPLGEKSSEGYPILRFPKKSRELMGLNNKLVIIGKGDHRIALEIRPAYKEDIDNLRRLLAEKKVTVQECKNVGFVSKDIMEKINHLRGGSVKDLWVTDSVEECTIGADPEFGLVRNTGELVKGNSVLPKRGKFGSDGPGVEVRPDPSRNHLGLIENIRTILASPPDPAKPYNWIGGATYVTPSRPYWFGGHIHFGRPLQISSEVAERCFRGLAGALDYFVSLPLVRIDMPNANLRRNGCNHRYGSAGEMDSIRCDYDAQISRFEYRVPSGFWLIHPTLARAVLGTAKCVAESFYRGVVRGDFKIGSESLHYTNYPAKIIAPLGINYKEIVPIINSNDVSKVTIQRLDGIKAKLREMEAYPDYSNEIEAFIEIAKTPGTEIKTGICFDLKKGWLEEKSEFLPAVKKPSLRAALEALIQ